MSLVRAKKKWRWRKHLENWKWERATKAKYVTLHRHTQIHTSKLVKEHWTYMHTLIRMSEKRTFDSGAKGKTKMWFILSIWLNAEQWTCASRTNFSFVRILRYYVLQMLIVMLWNSSIGNGIHCSSSSSSSIGPCILHMLMRVAYIYSQRRLCVCAMRVCVCTEERQHCSNQARNRCPRFFFPY